MGATASMSWKDVSTSVYSESLDSSCEENALVAGTGAGVQPNCDLPKCYHFQSDHWKKIIISMNISSSTLRDIIKASWMEVLREHGKAAGSVTMFYNELVARLNAANVNGQFDRWLTMTVPAHGVAVDANFKAVSVMMRMVRAITKVDPRKPQV